jgi:hypothetical protein
VVCSRGANNGVLLVEQRNANIIFAKGFDLWSDGGHQASAGQQEGANQALATGPTAMNGH